MRFDRPVVRDISFEVAEGVLALVGPSGCGKTTTLRLSRGSNGPTAARSGWAAGWSPRPQCMCRRAPRCRHGLPGSALFPHLSVFDNVAFGLRGLSRGSATGSRRCWSWSACRRWLRASTALSGGERRASALAAALAPQPVVVLMDEPFSSLDADMRLEVREQVQGILKTLHTTAVLSPTTRMRPFHGRPVGRVQRGRLEQIGTPEAVFPRVQHPVRGRVHGRQRLPEAGDPTPDGARRPSTLPQAAALPAGTPVEVALRGDDVDFVPAETGNAVVRERFFRGAFNVYRLALDSGQVVHAFKTHTDNVPAGARAFLAHPRQLGAPALGVPRGAKTALAEPPLTHR